MERAAKRRKLNNQETNVTSPQVSTRALHYIGIFSNQTNHDFKIAKSTPKRKGRPKKRWCDLQNKRRRIRELEALLRAEGGTPEGFRQIVWTLAVRTGMLGEDQRQIDLNRLQEAATRLNQLGLPHKRSMRRLLVNGFGQNLTSREIAACFEVSARTIQRDRATVDEVPECEHDRIITPDNCEVCIRTNQLHFYTRI